MADTFGGPTALATRFALCLLFLLGKISDRVVSSVSDTIFSSRCCHLRYHLPAEVSLLLLNAKLLVPCFASLWLLFDFLNYVLWSAFVTLTSQDIAIHPNTYWPWWHDHYCRWQHPDCGCGQLDLLDFCVCTSLIPMVPCFVLALFIGTADVTSSCSGAGYVDLI